MGRVCAMIAADGRSCWTLFDTGARNTCVIPTVTSALAMQQWGIRPAPDEERLDLSHYPEQFIEF